MATRYDVAIIGTGAGGGTLAYALAPTGKKILVLERGDYLPRENDYWDTRSVNLHDQYATKELRRHRHGPELHPHKHYHDRHAGMQAEAKTPKSDRIRHET